MKIVTKLHVSYAMSRRVSARRAGVHTGVGIGNFIDLVGVKPDFPFATFHDRGRKPLLKTQVTAIDIKR